MWFAFRQSKEECEYLINQAKPHMVKSSVVDSKTGQSKDSRFVVGDFFTFTDCQFATTSIFEVFSSFYNNFLLVAWFRDLILFFPSFQTNI